MHPRILHLLTPLLGDNIVLWGSKLVRRAPGQLHTWHVDIESSSPDGRFVTVWIGLENSGAASGLRLIAGSHLCRRTVQEYEAQNGCSRTACAATVLDWARSENPSARLVCPDMSDGDAILFDGRTWHGSHNRLAHGTRFALLLQYAAADSPIRMPDERIVTWPFKFLETPVPVLLVHGSGVGAANPISPSPRRQDLKGAPALKSFIRALTLPLPENSERKWQPYSLFRGSTPVVASMSCHASVLSGGHTPHPPHAHYDEELLFVLEGEAELLLGDQRKSNGSACVRVKAGDFAYYPPLQHHTIRNPTNSPVTYVMFRWQGAASLGGNLLRPSVVRAPVEPAAISRRPFVIRRVLEGSTHWLRKFHCHTTRMEVGGGYAPHVDPYDVAILVRSGRVKTLGKEIGPGAVVYYPAGELHGMQNVGKEAACYTVFEFHA
jgi:mannose-6-phosphate isomerase-like protein (cupin superfamily)